MAAQRNGLPSQVGERAVGTTRVGTARRGRARRELRKSRESKRRPLGRRWMESSTVRIARRRNTSLWCQRKNFGRFPNWEWIHWGMSRLSPHSILVMRIASLSNVQQLGTESWWILSVCGVEADCAVLRKLQVPPLRALECAPVGMTALRDGCSRSRGESPLYQEW